MTLKKLWLMTALLGLHLGNGSAATRGAGEPDARLYRHAGAT
jgi:hypothetical protein